MSEFGTRLTRASAPTESHSTSSESKADTACDSLLGTVKSTFDPFKQTFSSEGGTLHHVSEAVNSLASLQGMPSQLLNTGIAQIPLLDKMPGMPAATIGVPHLGTPHAHSHPPSSGFPLPSVGATRGSGCLSVLIGGIPAARVLDIGIAPTCGGITPYFDIQTGSSNTFIGGMRAARMGIDMTRHCNPMGHVGKSGGEAASAAEKGEEVASEAAQVSGRAKLLGRAGKAWSVGNAAVGPASGAATAADDASQGEVAAAAMMAAQTAADLAFMALSNLMGKDPGIEPSMGTLLAGDPTVLIGGFPLPDSQMMWHGAKHGIGKKVRPKLPKWAQKLACEFFGEPVSAVTGDVENDFTDYETDEVLPFKWGRHYSSGWHNHGGALGYGFRHAWQHELLLLRTRFVYIDPLGTAYKFGRRSEGIDGNPCQGYEIEQLDDQHFIVRHEVEGDLEFERTSAIDRVARCVGHVRNGIRSVLLWDGGGRLGSITQADEHGQVRRAIAFGYDQFERMVEIAVTDVDGRINRIARYVYDANGCLAAHRNALEATENYVYDTRRRMVRLTDANGYSFIYHYDVEGRCVESRGQDGLWHVRLQYHPGKTIVTESDGGKWTVLYNQAGTITHVVDPYGGVMEYVLGIDGRIESEIDSGGRVTSWLYSESGHNTGRADRWGNVWPPKDEAPVLRDRPVRKIPNTPLGLLWGEPNRARRVGKILLPPKVEAMATAMFGSAGHVSVGTKPADYFDAAGRLVSHIDTNGGVEHVQRDATGNVVARKDGDGRGYGYEIGSWNLRVAETDSLGNTVRYVHTSKQQIAAIIDANGNESSYTYDQKGRLTCVVRHGVVRETYAYDAANLLTEKRDGFGNVLLKFEADGRILYGKRVLASGDTHTYDYDKRGNTIRASTTGFNITMAYDRQDRRIADKRDGFGIEHTYANGFLASTTYFGRFTVRYETTRDQEKRIHTPDGGCHRYLHSVDERVLLEASNGSSILSCFDGAGRCVGQFTWSGKRQGQLHWTRYKYSATGELQQVQDSDGDEITYHYDAAHRLTGESHGGWRVRNYEYDRSSNLLSVPAVEWMRYIEGNRLSRSSIGTFEYDGRNHLSAFTHADGRTTNYDYDSKDLLVKVTSSDSPEVWCADYDGLSRRIYQSYGGETTHYYWDGDRLAAEQGGNGCLRLYVYANESAWVPFLFIDYQSIDAMPADGKAYLVHSNQIGLPRRIEDRSGATVWFAADTDPYGQICVAKGNKVDYNIRFPGHYFDTSTRLHYNRYRSYSPELGRYLQSDPKGQSGGINLYAYVANPLVVADVLGLSASETSCETGEDANQDPDVPDRENPSDRGTGSGVAGTNAPHVPTSEFEDLENISGDGVTAKPKGGAWRYPPNWKSWVNKKGGKIVTHEDGSVTYVRSDGAQVT